jgi:hypothetical protein
MSMNTSNPAVKDFLRKIGSKGGKKSAQHPDRPRLNQEAALARWRSHIPAPKTPEELSTVEQSRQSRKHWIANNPEKHRAHRHINNRIAKGTLKRQPCEVCGNTKSQAHHDDHSKPDEINWLCDKHHKERDKLLKNSS